ncbi:MAG TPA: prephenate dehydratase [Actinomycetota bacterium]|jgi:prephenate dehydratase|nr:prephenate dehydratase [Actinomycetota bacterium]
MVKAYKVGFQGEAGAYSEKAAKLLFPHASFMPFRSFHKVFEATEIGATDFGVVPIENSHAGSINDTYDLLVRHGVQIVAETIVRISHCLLAADGTSMADVKLVYSHPQALEQCEEFLDAIRAERMAVYDTAGAARLVADEKKPGTAAIASEEAAALYGLQVLAQDIEDRADNSTKFVAISRSATDLMGPPEKTSIVFATGNVPGALYACLREFSERQLNLTKLESRPSRARAWQYHFYLDFDAPTSDPAAQDVLAALAAQTSFLRVLGSYPHAVTTDSKKPVQSRGAPFYGGSKGL